MKGTIAAVAGLGVLAAIALCFAGSRVAPLMAQAPPAAKQYAKTVEITEPAAFTKAKDTRFVLKNDISVPRAGALKFTACEKIEIDLNGHTITYNTEDYNPQKEWGAGLNVSYSRDIVVRNGTIVQASEDTVTALGFGYCDDVLIDGVNVFVKRPTRPEGDSVTPALTATIGIFRYGAALKGPPEAAYRNAIRNCYLEDGGISLNEAYDYEISGNVIANAHCGMAVLGGQAKQEAGRRGNNIRIHDNRVQSLRVVGWKSPTGIYLAAARECEVYNNKFASDDARGVISSGGGPEKNVIHHNEISARYATASAVGYVDNRPYGIWTRNSWGTEIHHNRILVIDSSPFEGGGNYAIGIVCGANNNWFPANDDFNIHHNVITAMHDYPFQTSTGIQFGDGLRKPTFGSRERIENNVIRAQTLGLELDSGYFDPGSANVCEGNVIIGRAQPDAAWKGSNLPLPAGNRVEEEKTDKEAPAAPTGLQVRNRAGRAIVEWKWNDENDVVGYWVCKNGVKVPGTRFRGATFYVDVSPAPGDRYSVSARDFSGNEGPACAAVSTATAK